MTDEPVPAAAQIPEASVRRRRFSAIWLIPIIAAILTAYLGIHSYTQHGPVITISFRTADGLSAGQTTVKYKSVTLGTVDNVTLNKDMSGVVVRVRMAAKTNSILTDHSRFWIERPRLTSTNLSELVAGTFIQVDPGEPGGKFTKSFTGLENAPVLSTDEPGTTYTLKAERLGAVTEGSPVYYRDINVGKVLGTDIGNGFEPIKINVFVRSPYDKLVKDETRFWNSSGFSVKIGAGGLHVELQSLQSVLTGGIAFYTPNAAIGADQASRTKVFSLFEDRKLADSAAYSQHISYVTYVKNSIKDLAPGSPVLIFGIQVGEVTDVKLLLDKENGDAKVRVAFEIEPERAFGSSLNGDPSEIMRGLVQNGMRVKMGSSDFIAGQEIISLEFSPEKDAVEIAMEGDAMILPAQSSGLDSLTSALSDIVAKLNQIPFVDIGKNLNHLLASADQTVGGPEMKKAVHSLALTMANAQDISAKANKNLTPALERLPDISAQLQNAVAQANQLLNSVNSGYGQGSDFQRNSRHVLDEVNDAARSIRLLADYLEHHPEALLKGKTLSKSEPIEPTDEKVPSP